MQLDDFQLTEKIKSLFTEERKLTREILLHIVEVDRRRLFLKLAYGSLFDYLTKEIGYSQGAAQRRIDAARLIRRLPNVVDKIEAGTLSLAQISKAQKIFRQVKRESGVYVDSVTQNKIIQKIEEQSPEQTDLILAKEFKIKIETGVRKHVQRDESIRMEMTFSKAEMEILNQAQALLSHQTGGEDLKACLLALAKREIQRRMAARSGQTILSVGKKLKEKPRTATMAVRGSVKKFIFSRDQSCQFRNLASGRVCGSKKFLEIDHIQPKWAGGTNHPENLRVLCSAHNKHRYRAGR